MKAFRILLYQLFLVCISQNLYSQPPHANAGLDQHLQMPYSYTEIYGGYSTAGASSIAQYTWNQVSGPNTALLDSLNPVSGICHVTGMIAGSYEFELTVTDVAGLINKDTMSVVISNCDYNYNAPRSIIYPASGTVSQIYFPVNAQSAFNVKPGDTIKIDASRILNGKLSSFEIGNIHGCPGQPIIITNINGQVVCNKMLLGSDDSSRLRQGDTYVSYVNLIGNGVASVQYGFKVDGAMLSANFVSNMRLADFDISGGTLGFNVKVNNQNAGRFAEKKSYPNWWIRDIEIDHNYVHNIGGEGMYLGDTDPTSIGYCTGCTFAVQGDTILVHDNAVQTTQWDGIQVNSFRYAEIHNNYVNNYGTSNVNNQRAGIILGMLTKGSVQSNYIKKGTGTGIQVFGYDTILVQNNFLDSVGISTNEDGFFSNNYSNAPFSTIPGQDIIFKNNVVKYYKNDNSSKAFFIGNYQPGAGVAVVDSNTWCFGPNPPANWLTTKIGANSPGMIHTNSVLNCDVQIPYSNWPFDTNYFPITKEVNNKNIDFDESLSFIDWLLMITFIICI